VIVGFLTQVFKVLHKTKFTSKEMLLMWMEEDKSPGKNEAVSELTNWIDSLPDDEEEPQIEKSSEEVNVDDGSQNNEDNDDEAKQNVAQTNNILNEEDE
jgi:hypothetical protein